MKSPLLISLLVSSSMIHAEVPDDAGLEDRVEHLEDLVFDVTQQIGTEGILNTFNADNTRLGGFYHGIYNVYDSDTDSENGFDTNAIYLTLESDVAERWNFGFGYVIGEYGAPPELGRDGQLDTEDLNVSSSETENVLYARAIYTHSDAFEVILGRQRNPVGIISRELYPVGFMNPNLPQFLLNSGGAGTVFGTRVDGIGARGGFFPKGTDSVFSYHFVAGSTSFGNSGALINSISDSQASLRLGYGLIDQSFEFGLNMISGQRDEMVIESMKIEANQIPDTVFLASTSIEREGNAFFIVGADFLVDTDAFQFKAEYFLSDESGQPDIETYYVQPALHITDKWDVFFRHDSLDAEVELDVSASVTVLDEPTPGGTNTAAIEQMIEQDVHIYPYLGRSRVNVLGVNFKPNDNIRLRGGIGNRLYRDQNDFDYDFAYLSTTVAF